MLIIGADYVSGGKLDNAIPLKFVFNSIGVIIFPASEQHRDQRAPGITYEDNYLGNALAAMFSNGVLEIRYHQQFSAERVVNLIQRLADLQEMSFLKICQIKYQGRDLTN